MAMMLRVEGTQVPIAPAGPHWKLEELQALVGGYIEVVGTVDGPIFGHRRRRQAEEKAAQHSGHAALCFRAA